jgi:hypothetical protein
LQRDSLTTAEYVKVFEDRVSGARADRAGLRSALDYAIDGDVLIVWKLDRLGRSRPHLTETVITLEECGVGFHFITEAIDTTMPSKRLVYHRFGQSMATRTPTVYFITHPDMLIDPAVPVPNWPLSTRGGDSPPLVKLFLAVKVDVCGADFQRGGHDGYQTCSNAGRTRAAARSLGALPPNPRDI